MTNLLRGFNGEFIPPGASGALARGKVDVLPTGKHVLKREEELTSEHGKEDSWRLSTLRVFSSAPGTYGSGVELAVASSAWQEEQDLAEVYFNWVGHAYGDGVYARKVPSELLANCRRVTVTWI